MSVDDVAVSVVVEASGQDLAHNISQINLAETRRVVTADTAQGTLTVELVKSMTWMLWCAVCATYVGCPSASSPPTLGPFRVLCCRDSHLVIATTLLICSTVTGMALHADGGPARHAEALWLVEAQCTGCHS